MFKVVNNDTGSLKVGLVAGTKKWQVGDKIKIEGENKVRTTTYVMGSGERTHLCFKGQGPLPLGEVVFQIVEE
jgi:hypothetical protein